MAVLPTRLLEIEFDAGVWTDVGADLVALSTRRGRNRELGAYETGQLVFTLRNDTRKYDPGHAGGPYYGKLRPNRRVRFRVTYNAVTYPVFVGYIDRIGQVAGGPNAATAEFTVSDFFKLLNRAELPASVYAAEVAADDPTSWWRLDEPDGSTTALDAVGQAVATLEGTGGNFGAPTLVVRDPGAGFAGDGSADTWLRVTDPAALIAGTAFTIELLYAGTDANAFYHQSGGDRFMNYLVNGSGRIEFTYLSSPGGALLLAVVGSVNIQDGATHHVAVVYNGTDLRTYIDGVYDSAATVIVNTAGLTVPSPAQGGYLFWGGTGNTINGIGDEFALYNTALSPARIAAHNAAARTPWRNDLPGPRLDRIFDLAAAPAADRDIDTGTTTLQSTDLGGTALAYAQKVEETELGALFVARDGALTFIARDTLVTGDYLTPRATLVDDDSGAGIPYRAAAADVDEQIIVTRATVSRQGSVAVTVYDQAAADEFGWLDEVHDGLLHDDDDYSRRYAEWIVNTHKEPSSRVGTVNLTPTGDPAAMYPALLALELADRVTWKRKPQNVGAVTTVDMRVEAISHEFAGGFWSIHLQLSPVNLAGGLPVFVWDETTWDNHVWGI